MALPLLLWKVHSRKFTKNEVNGAFMKRITRLPKPAYIISTAAVGGREEGEGPFGSSFDFIDPSDTFGQKTWESAEAEMSRVALNVAMQKCSISHEDIDVIIA